MKEAEIETVASNRVIMKDKRTLDEIIAELDEEIAEIERRLEELSN